VKISLESAVDSGGNLKFISIIVDENIWPNVFGKLQM
jgi:hypothetical protein